MLFLPAALVGPVSLQRPVLSSRRKQPHFQFERLPVEIQREILSYMDYQSLIAFSCVSRYLQRTVDPQMATQEDKFAFVMRAENYFPKHFPVIIQGQEEPGNFACYICFRVRGPAHFEAGQALSIHVDTKGEKVTQESAQVLGPTSNAYLSSCSGLFPAPKTTHKLVSARRFCIGCGLRLDLYVPGDSIITKLNQEVWVCSCRMAWPKSAWLKCLICDKSCPPRVEEGSKYASPSCWFPIGYMDIGGGILDD